MNRAEAGPVLRSAQWFAGDDEVAMLHRVALRLGPHDAGKPIIGIADTTSDLNPCNAALGELIPVLAEAITAAGGVPVRYGAMTLSEDLAKPSAMLYRNLAAMELEEYVRTYPLDAVVYLAGCDKSVPAALMAAASTDIPSLLLLGAERGAPPFRGKPLGAGTDLWRALDDHRAGALDDAGWQDLERCLGCAGPGVCNTMGTASTLALVTETLGMAWPGSALVAAGSAAHRAAAQATGGAIVRMAVTGQRPAARLTQDALDNATAVVAAVGGSTNAVIHLAAIAGRLGLDASLQRADTIWRRVPLLADVEPCGTHLAIELGRAGGVAGLLAALGNIVQPAALAGDGRPWAAVIAEHVARTASAGDGGSASAGAAEASGATDREAVAVLRSLADPVAPAPTLAAVFGSLAPAGAVIKVAAADPALLVHTGPALVFDTYADMRARLDDPGLDVSADTVIVVRGCGPAGVPGMPEWGMAPIPQRLAEQGVRDMVRITDGRMSGTSFGTVALHVSPEAAIGGPLALVRDGDLISLDVPARRLNLLVDIAELRRREQTWKPPARPHLRGWPALYQEHVQQAHLGADLEFLTAPSSEHRRFVPPVIGRS